MAAWLDGLDGELLDVEVLMIGFDEVGCSADGLFGLVTVGPEVGVQDAS